MTKRKMLRLLKKMPALEVSIIKWKGIKKYLIMLSLIKWKWLAKKLFASLDYKKNCALCFTVPEGKRCSECIVGSEECNGTPYDQFSTNYYMIYYYLVYYSSKVTEKYWKFLIETAQDEIDFLKSLRNGNNHELLEDK